jgi:P27 family predicted phage terminase small subunit
MGTMNLPVTLRDDLRDKLSEETKKFIDDVMRELTERGVLENLDYGAMRMLATAYETYRKASNRLIDEGPIIISNFTNVANPVQSVVTKSYAQVMKIMTEYGLTIKSRARIPSMNQDKSDSPLDVLFKSQGIEKR